MNTLNRDGEVIDLTEIARNVATTREGRRLHHQVTEKLQKRKENNSLDKKVSFCLFFFCLLFACFCCCFFALFAYLFLLPNYCFVSFA